MLILAADTTGIIILWQEFFCFSAQKIWMRLRFLFGITKNLHAITLNSGYKSRVIVLPRAASQD